MDVDVQEDRFIVKTHTYTAHHTTNAQPCCTCFSPFLPPETNATAGFSTVYLVRDTRTRDQLALKRMLCQERESTEAAYREVQVLRAVRHRNVVSLLDQVPHSTPLHPTPNFTSPQARAMFTQGTGGVRRKRRFSLNSVPCYIGTRTSGTHHDTPAGGGGGGGKGGGGLTEKRK